MGYPKIGADGANGAFVAGSGLAFDGWDTFLFHVDSAGNSLWEVSDSACYIAPGNQYPIALYPDGTGGCVALIDEEVLNFPNPSRNRVQIIRYDAEGHKVWQYMPYDTTWEMLHGFGAMAVTHGQVFVFWYSSARLGWRLAYAASSLRRDCLGYASYAACQHERNQADHREER